jgi:hypothetical protein
VTGSTTFNNGSGAGSTTFNSTTSCSLGSLSFTALDGNDTFTLLRTTVTLATTIATGDGADNVNIDDSTLHGAVAITTGGGNDTVSIERAGSTNVPTTFQAAVNISTGSGDDALRIALDTNDNAIFQLAPITFNGGLGLDLAVVLTLNSYPIGQPVITNFETVS